MSKAPGVLMILLCLIVAPRLPSQETEPIQEAVSVINVEVPVRVFTDGESVSGLKKEDFQISEDGKPQQINGFYVFHKKLGPGAPSPSEPSPIQAPGGRYFVLIFRLYECNESIEKALAYLFQGMLRPDDQVLVMANNRTLMIEKLADRPGAHAEILELLRSESHSARNQMLSALQIIEQNVDMTNFKLKIKDANFQLLRPEIVIHFLQNYLQSWLEFKRRYLALELDKFYYFARHLEHVRKEKWVLNFYQLEQFPKIAFDTDVKRYMERYKRNFQQEEHNVENMGPYSQVVERLLQTINSEMKVAKDFPSEEVSKLFYKVNATFHSFFTRAFYLRGNQELQFQDVASDIENSLRALTEATGGTLSASNQIDASLQSVQDKVDDFYVLTYEPANAKKVGKIKVTVRERKYKVLYDNNIRADYISAYLKKKEAENPSVKVTDLAFENKKLSFVIRDFSLAKVKDDTVGALAVRVRVKDVQERSFFDQSKNLQTSKKTVSLSLGFASLDAGKYDVIVDVLDQVSKKTATAVIQPVIE